jgi:DNA-directed RNA polymerase subunit F
LRTVAERAETELRAVLKTSQSAEQRRRLQAILDSLAPTKPPPPDVLRELRAVAVLEYIGNAEAKKFLEELATGVESARLTRDAKETLGRIKNR